MMIMMTSNNIHSRYHHHHHHCEGYYSMFKNILVNTLIILVISSSSNYFIKGSNGNVIEPILCNNNNDNTYYCKDMVTFSPPTKFGNVCAQIVGGTLEVNITVLQTLSTCSIAETHICNIPSVVYKPDIIQSNHFYSLDIDEVYDYICSPNIIQEEFTVAGHATIECDEEIGPGRIGGARDGNAGNSYTSYYEIDLCCPIDEEEEGGGGGGGTTSTSPSTSATTTTTSTTKTTTEEITTSTTTIPTTTTTTTTGVKNDENKCPKGEVEHPDNIFCGRGPNRQDCPKDYSCNIHPTDKYAVCCKASVPLSHPVPPEETTTTPAPIVTVTTFEGAGGGETTTTTINVPDTTTTTTTTTAAPSTSTSSSGKVGQEKEKDEPKQVDPDKGNEYFAPTKAAEDETKPPKVTLPPPKEPTKPVTVSEIPTKPVVEEEEEIVSYASYKLKFINLWSSIDHPNDYPSDAHWSPPVIAMHNKYYQMWNVGRMASPGIQEVAETGATTTILDELEERTNDNSVDDYDVGEPQWNDEIQYQEIEFEISSNHPLVSVISMIAPSPDWFAGVHDIKLTNNIGEWIDNITLESPPYDAGTDSGITYKSDDLVTTPQVPIFELTNATVSQETLVFVNNNNNNKVLPVAKFEFTFLEIVE